MKMGGAHPVFVEDQLIYYILIVGSGGGGLV